jgi:disulfide bond formation protein DsbB
MMIPSKRVLNLAGFLACAGMMAFALYVEYGLELEPCPLCVFQRIAVISVGIVFLLLTLHNPSAGWARRIYLGLMSLAVCGGAAVASRHVWLQHLPPDKVPSCGPGLGYMLDTFPFADALKMVFSGSGECAEVAWSLFGLSMPSWVLLALLGLGSFAFWNNLRRN